MRIVSADVLGQGMQETVSLRGFSSQGSSRLLGVQTGEHADVEFVVLGMVADQRQQGVRGGRVAGAGGLEQDLGPGEGVFRDVRVFAVDQCEQVVDALGAALRVLVGGGTDDGAPRSGRGSSGRFVSGILPVRAQAMTLPML
nr:hypothetical protein [Streptomyces sp. LBUM 1477]